MKNSKLNLNVSSKYHPESGETEEVASGLWYANGVAVAHDEESVLL